MTLIWWIWCVYYVWVLVMTCQRRGMGHCVSQAIGRWLNCVGCLIGLYAALQTLLPAAFARWGRDTHVGQCVPLRHCLLNTESWIMMESFSNPIIIMNHHYQLYCTVLYLLTWQCSKKLNCWHKVWHNVWLFLLLLWLFISACWKGWASLWCDNL